MKIIDSAQGVLLKLLAPISDGRKLRLAIELFNLVDPSQKALASELNRLGIIDDFGQELISGVRVASKGAPPTDNETNRDSWIQKKLKSFESGHSILDVGAGEKPYQNFCSHLKYKSQDFNKYDGAGNGTGLQMGKWNYNEIDYISDITSIPVQSDSFDYILCTEVLEHVPNPIAALNEMKRLLKTGGEIIITAPFDSLVHFAPYFYFSGFSKYFYLEFLEKNGFSIIELSENGSYVDLMIQEINRLQSESLKKTNNVNLRISSICGLLIRALIESRKEFQELENLSCFGWHVHAKKI